MKVAVYSGSFNPLHIGHLAIMEYLQSETDFDCIYLIVSPQSPFKEASNNTTAQKRFEAAIEAAGRHPELHIHVDDIELTMEPPQYTIKTLDALKRREPENEFVLVIGADNLEKIHGWRDFRRILSEYGVVTYPRTGYDLESIRKKLLEECRKFPTPYVLDQAGIHFNGETVSLEEDLEAMYHIEIADAPIVNISSTEIREGFARGEDMSAYLM